MTVHGAGARNKGNAYERELAHAFDAAGFPGLQRTPNSGGLHIPCDLVGLDGFAIEAKRQETMKIWPFLAQAAAQAVVGETPLLIFRRNRSASYACLPLADFLALLHRARA